MDDITLLTDIFREELDDSKLEIDRSTSQETLGTWDSLAHVRLIARIEEEFGFQFSLSQIEDATSVAALLDVIAANKD